MRTLRSALLLMLAFLLATATAAQAAPTGGSGGPLTDRLNVPYTANGITSNYHIYAAGLNWTKPVGLLMYADGSGGYGYDHPNVTYSLGGTNGVVAVAKRNNLLLVVPNAPAPGCDGYDNCWYNASGTPSAAAKAGWSSSLMTKVKGQYNIEQDRIAIGGYSSGAQWASRFFMPQFGEAQSVDLAVMISFGGAPAVASNFTAAYKAATVMSWDIGTLDSGGYSTGAAGGRGGYSWYTSAGFKTQMNAVSGEDHSRDGLFGSILDREIKENLKPAS
jgi:poly(3-hydroxybutyrate) depolymerase